MFLLSALGFPIFNPQLGHPPFVIGEIFEIVSCDRTLEDLLG